MLRIGWLSEYKSMSQLSTEGDLRATCVFPGNGKLVSHDSVQSAPPFQTTRTDHDLRVSCFVLAVMPEQLPLCNTSSARIRARRFVCGNMREGRISLLVAERISSRRSLSFGAEVERQSRRGYNTTSGATMLYGNSILGVAGTPRLDIQQQTASCRFAIIRPCYRSQLSSVSFSSLQRASL
jgi:hypothetical protein